MVGVVPPVVVLAGGLGTRLREVTSGGPKALADVAGAPMLRHILDHWASRGAREVVLCLGHQADLVEASVRQWPDSRIDINIIRESKPLGTGGAIRHALDRLPGEFIVVNGDTVVDVHLGAVVRWRQHHAGAATLVVNRSAAGDGDRIEVAEDGTIVSFSGRGPASASAWVFAGVALCTRSLFEMVATGVEANLERDILAPAVARGVRLGALRTERPFYDLGTPERLAQYQRRLSNA